MAKRFDPSGGCLMQEVSNITYSLTVGFIRSPVREWRLATSNRPSRVGFMFLLMDETPVHVSIITHLRHESLD
jgi:hypothetical protein